MSKPEKKGLVPAMRFAEFKDASEWVGAKLGEKDVSTFVKEKVPSDVLTLKSYVSTENLLPDYAGVTTASKLPATGNFTRYKKGDILVSNIRPYLKKVWAATNEGATSNDVIVIRAKSKVRDSFLTYLLRNDEFINYVMKGAQGVKMPRGDISLMKEYPVAIPASQKEQQKVADCLTSVDELITAQVQKINALKFHKKGLMQQLFPAAGEAVPKLRFPEFRDKGAWERNQLGTLSMIVRGGSPRPIEAYLTHDNNGLNWLKIGDVDKESKYVTRTEERVKKSALSKTRVVNPGDLIMSNSMSYGRPYILKIKSCIHDGWIAVTEINGSIDCDYLYYLILSNESQVYFSNAAAGGGVKNLNADIIKALPVAYPKKLEQKKIADCLASVDDLIAAQSLQLDVLKTHKKGLMQQLFPAMDEVCE